MSHRLSSEEPNIIGRTIESGVSVTKHEGAKTRVQNARHMLIAR